MRRFLAHSKILYSLLAVMLAIALVPLGIVSWRLISINRTSLTATQREVQLDDARSRAREVSAFVRGYLAQTSGFARALEVAGGAAAGVADGDRLGDALRRDTNLLAIGFLRSDGTLSAQRDAGRLSGEDLDRLVAPLAMAATDGGPAIGAPERRGSPGIPVVAMSDAVHAGGRTIGHVVTVVDLTAAFPFVDGGAPDGGAEESLQAPAPAYFVVDEAGRPLAFADVLADAAGGLPASPLVDAWVRAGGEPRDLATEFDGSSGAAGRHQLGSLATVDLPGGRKLAVASVVSRDAALAAADRMTTQTLWACFIVAFVTVLVAILFAGYIANPIKELAIGARAIADGDFSHRIRVWSTNETGQLATDFNRMAERLSGMVREMREAAERNHDLFIGTVRGLAAAIDGKDPYTRGHSERVAEYSSAMAIELGLSEQEVEKIRISGLMHDVGKLSIEDKILRKPAPLTDEEFEIMREHPERGTLIMSEIPHMREFIPGMRFHHEMMNGKGYPLGLEGDQIPLMAKIVSVADTFDAMTTNRPYQKQMPIDLVFEKIREMAGVRYDPDVVEALIRAYDNGRIRLRMQKSVAGRTV